MSNDLNISFKIDFKNKKIILVGEVSINDLLDLIDKHNLTGFNVVGEVQHIQTEPVPFYRDRYYPNDTLPSPWIVTSSSGTYMDNIKLKYF